MHRQVGLLSHGLDQFSHLLVQTLLEQVLPNDGIQWVPEFMGHARIDHSQQLVLGLVLVLEDVAGRVYEVNHVFGLALYLKTGRLDFDIVLFHLGALGTQVNL